MNIRSFKSFLGASIFIFAHNFGAHAGCGLWRLPVDKLEMANERGHVSLWKEIDTLRIGSISFPIVIGFESGSKKDNSPLGYGWILPLFYSSIVQVNEERFELLQPDGWSRPFLRNKKHPDVIEGVGGWKGEVLSTAIKIHLPCGWSLTYDKGKLSSLKTPAGEKMEISRKNDGALCELIHNNRLIASFSQEKATLLLKVQNRTYEFIQDKVPVIQKIGDARHVVSLRNSMSEIRLDGQTVMEFLQSTTDSLDHQMVILPENTTVKWNPENGTIISYGDWDYMFHGLEGAEPLSGVTRKNKKTNEKEGYTKAASTQMLYSAGGMVKEITRFASGILAGKIRNVKTSLNGNTVHTYSASYNEQGEVIREEDISDNQRIKKWRGKNDVGPFWATEINGNVSRLIQFDSDGSIKSVYNDGEMFDILNGNILTSQKDKSFKNISLLLNQTQTTN